MNDRTLRIIKKETYTQKIPFRLSFHFVNDSEPRSRVPPRVERGGRTEGFYLRVDGSEDVNGSLIPRELKPTPTPPLTYVGGRLTTFTWASRNSYNDTSSLVLYFVVYFVRHYPTLSLMFFPFTKACPPGRKNKRDPGRLILRTERLVNILELLKWRG